MTRNLARNLMNINFRLSQSFIDTNHCGKTKPAQKFLSQKSNCELADNAGTDQKNRSGNSFRLPLIWYVSDTRGQSKAEFRHIKFDSRNKDMRVTVYKFIK